MKTNFTNEDGDPLAAALQGWMKSRGFGPETLMACIIGVKQEDGGWKMHSVSNLPTEDAMELAGIYSSMGADSGDTFNLGPKG